MQKFVLYSTILLVCSLTTGCNILKPNSEKMFESGHQNELRDEENVWNPITHPRDRSFSGTGIDPQARDIEKRLGY